MENENLKGNQLASKKCWCDWQKLPYPNKEAWSVYLLLGMV